MSTPKTATAVETWLGATQPVGALLIVFFVPSKDRLGREIGHDLWVSRALETFGSLFRGDRVPEGPRCLAG